VDAFGAKKKATPKGDLLSMLESLACELIAVGLAEKRALRTLQR